MSCKKDNKGMSTVVVEAALMPRMHTEDVTTLISDSGVARYRISAKTWDMYENDTTSYWLLPDGVYAEQLSKELKADSLPNIEASLKADTAYYYSKRSLMHLIGNVYISNTDGMVFETSELFYDEKPQSPSNAIYTDKFVKVTSPDGTVFTGIGMKSDASMKEPIFYKTTAEIEIKEEIMADSTTVDNDSVAVNNNMETENKNE
ncbi:LPS export ABC transporter protein LptC [Dysgonomonadaceae bacterium PH5-43]|nr:LPS export ABC transporter protein LptC [Dysgonomonadaceae bacterium PH5-43]